VLVSEEAQLIIASNRAENTVAIFSPCPDPEVSKVAVGVHSNGLAYGHGQRQVLVASVGDPAIPGSHTLSVVSLDDRAMRAEITVPGRTRWAVHDPDAMAFYLNIADPAQIVVVEARRADRISRAYPIPSAGPHGLDLDTHRLFCACDSGVLVTLDARSGRVLGRIPLSGSPDVVTFDRVRKCLYVAVGDPGTIDMFDTKTMQKLGSCDRNGRAHLCPRTRWRPALRLPPRRPSGSNLSDRRPRNPGEHMRKTQAKRRIDALAMTRRTKTHRA
jgi:hypothetical protein